MLKTSEFPDGLQGKDFKDRVREGRGGVRDQLVDTLLIGWWRGNWESLSGSSWSGVWGLRAFGQQTVNFSHPAGVSVSAKQLKGHGSEYYLQPLRRNQRSLTLMAKLLLFCFA